MPWTFPLFGGINGDDPIPDEEYEELFDDFYISEEEDLEDRDEPE